MQIAVDVGWLSTCMKMQPMVAFFLFVGASHVPVHTLSGWHRSAGSERGRALEEKTS